MAKSLVALQRSLASAANLANLLPTNTVLAFQALVPCFSNNGSCQLSLKYLTACLIAFCSLICFLSSFTDSFTGNDGRIYYGIATFKGFFVFNYQEKESNVSKLKISLTDFVHAFISLALFLIFALANSQVLTCFFPQARANENALIVNLPLGAGILATFFFTIFPTTRRGIGYADMSLPTY